MKKSHHSELSIQNNIDELHLAESYISGVAELLGFSQHDSKQIQLALEEAISNLEGALVEAGNKLENPLEASESIADLGERYVSLQTELDEKWEQWHALFED